MRKTNDDRLIMVVAQLPFEHDLNQFCKLVPALYMDGARPNQLDFPNDGEIWWMLTARTASLAEPGHLVVGNIEDAPQYDAHNSASSRYQAVRDSVRALDLRCGAEVVNVPGDAVDSLQDLVSGGFRLPSMHRPTPQVMIRWRSEVFGPFNAQHAAHNSGEARVSISLMPTNADMTVFRLPDEQFRSAAKEFLVTLSNDVSATANRRSESYKLLVEHELLRGPGYQRVLAQNPQKLVLEPIDRKLNRFAKDCLLRKKRQELRHLLDELEVTGRETQEAEDFIQTVRRVKQTLEKQDASLDAVAKALLESGFLGEDRIQKAEQGHAEQYVQERTAALQAQLDEKLLTKREELRRADAELRDVQARLQEEKESRQAQLRAELAAERKKAEDDIAADRENLKKQRTELERQQEMLQKNLEQVTKDLREAGDEIVNRFLTIAPLLGLAGFRDGGTSRKDSAASESVEVKRPPARFELPPFVTRATLLAEGVMSENSFFERFSRVVENSGFYYRPLDLIRFHLSVKVGVLTVLGGPSGTGKSSLPLLYARALSGEEVVNGRPDCLMVNVNPSWMEVRDLLGHMNTLEGRFYPAESGLFQQLLFAQEEYKARASLTGIYLACLDEMNLSQVEHYFSDLMMVLEREGDQRRIQCFSPDVAGDACPFREWSTIRLSPALRFLGTVNFDETTRLLSDRFLDRTNLIQLPSGTLPAVAGSGAGLLATAEGRMVTLADIDSWQGNDRLPTELASLLDEMRPVLQELGCPISPRAYRGICKFVGAAAPLLAPAKAFDLQITQRVLPKIRSLVTRRQLDALDNLLRLLNETSACSFDETMPLLEEVRESSTGRDWIAEDQ